MEDYKYLAIVEWTKKYISTRELKPKDRFLTEKELCEIHGVSRQTVNYWIDGQRDILVSRLHEVADALNVRVRDLFDE